MFIISDITLDENNGGRLNAKLMAEIADSFLMIKLVCHSSFQIPDHAEAHICLSPLYLYHSSAESYLS